MTFDHHSTCILNINNLHRWKWYVHHHLSVLFRCLLCCMFSFTCSLSWSMNWRRFIQKRDCHCTDKQIKCKKYSQGNVNANIKYIPVFSAPPGHSLAKEFLWVWGWIQNQAVICQNPTLRVFCPETNNYYRVYYVYAKNVRCFYTAPSFALKTVIMIKLINVCFCLQCTKFLLKFLLLFLSKLNTNSNSLL